jgi:aminoglycoside phosphotransferase (APT) family kinase protein
MTVRARADTPFDREGARAVLAALVRHGLVPDEPGWRVEVAPGGTTDRTFGIFDPAGVARYTARLARPGLGARLRYEEQVLRELAGQQAALGEARTGETVPRPYTPREIIRVEDDALPGGGMLVHEHQPGRPAPVAMVSAAARERLGACLAWVHRHPREGYMLWPSLDARRGTRAALFRDRLATVERYASVREPLLAAPALVERLRALDLPPSAGWQQRGFVLLHGDLSSGNILWDGEHVTLIDWEFARDGDPAEDLAYLVSEQQMPPDLVAEIAEAYVAESGDPWALARLPAWLPLVALDAALWWADYRLAQRADPTRDPDVRARLERATGYMPH